MDEADVDEPFDVAGEVVTAVSAMSTAVSIADATRPDLPLVYVNPAFERLTGYAAAEALGRNARFMQGPDTDPVTVRAMREGLRLGRFTRARVVNYRADGSAYWIELHMSPVHDADGRLLRFIAVQHDVTTEVLAQMEAVHAATRDGLTGLMNRGAFAVALERELARARRHGSAVAVLFLDVDGFKEVNDRYGHLVGDGHLVHVGECLRTRLRRDDAAARVGGDEFMALLTDLPADASAARQVVEDLDRALGRPFRVDGVEHRASVTIGTAVFPHDGTTVHELIARADADMYRRKRRRARQDAAPGAAAPEAAGPEAAGPGAAAAADGQPSG